MPTSPSRPVPVLAAPTAAGKTAAVLELSKDFALEVIAADAMTVYKKLDIGTAKPTLEERESVPHHLVDILKPDQPFSVADFVRLAEAAISEVRVRGKLPVVVGGNGFYIRALTRGLPTVPATDETVQAELWERLEQEGLDALNKELERASPRDAERAQRNPRRVVRALEILQRTGKPPSAFGLTTPAFTYSKLALLPTMDVLRPRIEQRTQAMFDAGLIDEVKTVLTDYPALATARQAIGYKEVAAYLKGDSTLRQARAAVTLATVQYAKRQRTWFRKEPDTVRREALAGEVLGELREWLEGLA